jgi:hypothetical protein
MSHQNPHGRDPEELRLEQELEALRRSGAGSEPSEPPALLDQAVMNMARRALPKHPARQRMRWLGAFATATVVVLAFTFALQQDPLSPPDSDGLHLEPLPEAEKRTERPAAIRESTTRQAPVPARSGEEPHAARADAEAAAVDRQADDMEFSAAADTGDANREAEAWIERLLSLHESQQTERLEAELSAFRKAYPDYPLPPELLD